MNLQGLVDLRRRRERARVAEGLPVRVLTRLRVRRSVMEEQRHPDQRSDARGGARIGERGVAKDLFPGLLRGRPGDPLAAERIDQLEQAAPELWVGDLRDQL